MRKSLICITKRLMGVIIPACFLLSGCVTETIQYEGNESSGSGSGGGTLVPKQAPIDQARRYETRFDLAVAYYQGGQYEVAMQEVDKALQVKSRSPEATLLKGMIYERQGASDSALEYMRRAMSYKPGDGDYIHNYGVALCSNKNYAEGIKYLSQAINVKGYVRVANSWAGIGSCYAAQGHAQQAEEAFKKALELDPSNGYALYQLTNFLYNNGDYHAARQYFNRFGVFTQQNAATLWLGIRIAHKQGDALFGSQLARILRERFPASAERNALERGDFDFK